MAILNTAIIPLIA